MRLACSLLALVLVPVFAAAQAPASPPPASVPAAEAAPAAPATQAPAAAAAAPAHAGDPAAGAAKAATCGACHGADGNSADKQYPKIAGQHERYIARQLQLFKTGERENPVMLGLVAALSPQDMRDLGAFFASKQALPGTATEGKIKPDGNETWVQRGERLFRGGDKTAGTPACMACHGPSGRGNPGPAYPSLAGQHADYTKLKLQAFRDGAIWGKGDNANPVMTQVVHALSADDIEALSTYIEGLHRSSAGAEGAAAP